MWGEDGATEDEILECCRPLNVEVFSVPSSVFEEWSSPGRCVLQRLSWLEDWLSKRYNMN